jgi:hypothetical protein
MLLTSISQAYATQSLELSHVDVTKCLDSVSSLLHSREIRQIVPREERGTSYSSLHVATSLASSVSSETDSVPSSHENQDDKENLHLSQSQRIECVGSSIETISESETTNQNTPPFRLNGNVSSATDILPLSSEVCTTHFDAIVPTSAHEPVPAPLTPTPLSPAPLPLSPTHLSPHPIPLPASNSSPAPISISPSHSSPNTSPSDLFFLASPYNRPKSFEELPTVEREAGILISFSSETTETDPLDDHDEEVEACETLVVEKSGAQHLHLPVQSSQQMDPLTSAFIEDNCGNDRPSLCDESSDPIPSIVSYTANSPLQRYRDGINDILPDGNVMQEEPTLARPKSMKKVESFESFVRPPLPPQRAHCPVPPPRKTKMKQSSSPSPITLEHQQSLVSTWDPKLGKFKYPKRPKNT